MDRSAKPGRRCRPRKRRTLLALAALGLGAGLTGAGCSTAHLTSNEKVGDPLLGPAPATLAQPVPPPQTSSNSGNGLAPVPSSAGLSTNAALASQTPTAQALAIGNASADSWQRSGQGASPGAITAPTTPQPRVVPVPKDTGYSSSTAQPIQPAGSWAASSAPAPSAEQLDATLKAHGVIGHKQEAAPGGIHLVCAVANPSNPNANQIYEVTAADYAAAVQAIVRQIDAPRP
jgi:hypothetical protein